MLTIEIFTIILSSRFNVLYLHDTHCCIRLRVSNCEGYFAILLSFELDGGEQVNTLRVGLQVDIEIAVVNIILLGAMVINGRIGVI